MLTYICETGAVVTLPPPLTNSLMQAASKLGEMEFVIERQAHQEEHAAKGAVQIGKAFSCTDPTYRIV